MTQSVMRISEPSDDVLLETDPRKFHFDSEYNVLKVLVEDIFTISYNAPTSSPATKSYPHGLGYVPIVFLIDTTNNCLLPIFIPVGAGVYIDEEFTIDNANVNVSIDDQVNSGPQLLTFKIHILADKIY